MSKAIRKSATPLTREQVLDRIKRPMLQKEFPGLGLAKYRRLSAEQRYMIQSVANDGITFSARAVIYGFEEPKFLPEDEAALKDGAFGPVMAMSAAVLEDTEITEDDLAK